MKPPSYDQQLRFIEKAKAGMSEAYDSQAADEKRSKEERERLVKDKKMTEFFFDAVAETVFRMKSLDK